MYDVRIECYDWRYSAAILGLVRFFDYWKIKETNVPAEYDNSADTIEFDSRYITREKYLDFVEYYANEILHDEMYHTKVETFLRGQESFTDEQIKRINELLKANSIMKEVYGKIKFDGNNRDEILSLLQERHYDIVEKTFQNKKNLYANYCNSKLIGEDTQPHCRLLGYSVDEGRKSKSYAYAFQDVTGVFRDSKYFDFIPFAFTNTMDAIFINNNYNIENLRKSNDYINDQITIYRQKKENEQKPLNVRSLLYQAIIQSVDFIDYDIEIIIKGRDKEYFETLYIRKDKIDIVREIKDISKLMYSYKINDKYYINVGEELIQSVINGLDLSWLIELALKKELDNSNNYAINRLIEINMKIKGVDDMEKKLSSACACAWQVTRKLKQKGQDNKIKSYKVKLASAMTANDKKRVYDILLQLSIYTEESFGFLYSLLDDYDKNQEIVYAFINALGAEPKKKEA